MRLLADENIEQPIVHRLRAEGHDVAYMSELAPGASDDHVLQLANEQCRLILTNDKDFGELVYRDGRASAGIVLLRLTTEDGGAKASRLADILPVIEDRLPERFAVVTEHSVRLRPLRGLRP